MQPTPQREAMTKREVCQVLGKSVRTVAQYIASGKLPCTYVSGPNGREARFDPAEVEHLRRNLAPPLALARPVAPQTTGKNRKLPETTETALVTHEALDAIARRISDLARESELARERWAPKPELPVTPFLALDAAAEYSGLPARLLARRIRVGTLRAMRFSGRWYVKRADLEALDLVPEGAT